jgi:putative flippase GtrA
VAVARLRHLYETFEHLIHEIAKFGVVGAVNYAVDVGLFNVLVTGSLQSSSRRWSQQRRRTS